MKWPWARKGFGPTPQERARKVHDTLSDVTGNEVLTDEDRAFLKRLRDDKSRESKSLQLCEAEE